MLWRRKPIFGVTIGGWGEPLAKEEADKLPRLKRAGAATAWGAEFSSTSLLPVEGKTRDAIGGGRRQQQRTASDST